VRGTAGAGREKTAQHDIADVRADDESGFVH